MRARARPCRRRRGARRRHPTGPPPPTPPGQSGSARRARDVVRVAGWGHAGGAGAGGVVARPGREPRPAGRAGARGRRPGGAPRGLRPRLRRGRAPTWRTSPSRSTGPSWPRWSGSPPSAAPPWSPGCSSGATARRTTPSWCAAARAPTTARSISTTRSATASPTSSPPGRWTPVTVELGGITVGVMTCYDLRFPEQARALVDRGAEVLLVPAAWVAGPRKVDHWTTLLRARAIENTVYVVGVGQPGPRYTGHSMVVGPLGDVLVEGGDGRRDAARRARPRARWRRPAVPTRRWPTGACNLTRRVQGCSTSSCGPRAGRRAARPPSRRRRAGRGGDAAAHRRGAEAGHAVAPDSPAPEPAADRPPSGHPHRLGVGALADGRRSRPPWRWSPRSPAPTDRAG